MGPAVTDIYGERSFQKLLQHIKSVRGVDFSVYRPRTIGRRIAQRLRHTDRPDHASYLRYLQENPGEMDALMSSLTIKVSSFFRDPLVFELLGSCVMPELLTTFRGKSLRIWSAGCARGEEVYSLAILLKEACTNEELSPHIFMIGTDIDPEALEDAERAVYDPAAVTGVKKGCLDTCFHHRSNRYCVTEEIKQAVSFVCHDLTACSSPAEGIFSDYQLVLCRNLLMYFEREMQEQVLRFLSSAIPPGGFLVLGRAETLPDSLSAEFREYMPCTKVFRKRRG